MWSWHVASVDPGFHLILAEHLQKVQPTHTFSSIPRFQTCPCSCHSPSPHIFLSLPTKPNRLRLSWKSEAESGADLRHLIRPLTGGFMCMEYFGEAHHNSCGMDSLCIWHESSTRAASQRGVLQQGCSWADPQSWSVIPRRARLHSQLPHLSWSWQRTPSLEPHFRVCLGSGCSSRGGRLFHKRGKGACVATCRIQQPILVGTDPV